VDGVCLNKELLRAGLAWHYKRYSSDRDIAILEEEARAKGIGLWSEPQHVPPWEWRRVKRGR